MVDVVAVGALLAPYLSKTVERVATRASEAVGDAAWGFAHRIWSKLGDRLAERPAAQEAVDDVAAAPDDEGARVALERQLGKVLDADPELAAEIEAVLKEAVRAGVVVQGNRNIVIKDADLTSSAVIGGDGNTVNIG